MPATRLRCQRAIICALGSLFPWLALRDGQDLTGKDGILTPLIKTRTGQAPSTLVWPYGASSETAWDIAKTVGFDTSLVLGKPQKQTLGDAHIRRHLISNNPGVAGLANLFRAPRQGPTRVIHVDLDYIHDPDPGQQHRQHR